jgi:hypothetical protein
LPVFSQDQPDKLPTFAETEKNNLESWKTFWEPVVWSIFQNAPTRVPKNWSAVLFCLNT